jgi:hypothetical protein
VCICMCLCVRVYICLCVCMYIIGRLKTENGDHARVVKMEAKGAEDGMYVCIYVCVHVLRLCVYDGGLFSSTGQRV